MRIAVTGASGFIGGATAELVGRLEAGEASNILAGSEDSSDDALDRATDASSEGAAFDSGTD